MMMMETQTVFTVGNSPAKRWVRADDQMPALGATSNDADPLARVKLFVPWGRWTWYLTEADPLTGEAFGMVHGDEQELGYFSLTELAALRGPGGLTVERDLHWTPRPVSKL